MEASGTNWKRLAWNGFFVAALGLAVYLLYRVFEAYSLRDIIRSLESIPLSRLCMAIGFAAASYACLTLVDYLAIRSLGKKLPYPQVAQASFVSLSLGHTIGFAGLSSGAFRYRYYSRAGLTAEDVAKIILFCGVTVAMGLVTLGGAGLALDPADGARLLHVPEETAALFGYAAFLVPLVYLALSTWVRGRLKIWRWSFQFPKARLAMAQIAAGTVNFLFVSACLHQLLSSFGEVPFLRAVLAFVLANSAILATHVPGGLGVLEATVSYAVPQEASIGALIAFRCVYFFLPLALGITLFVVGETLLGKSRSVKGPVAPAR